jgi:hypothetical protein
VPASRAAPRRAVRPGRHRPEVHGPSRAQWMALAFAAGSTCFLIGPFPGYVELVGPVADAMTFFVGSLLFTAGGALQVWLAALHRGDAGAGRAAWWTATTQFAGTLFFNATTFRALDTALSNPAYDRLVWRPDAFGSICFLISGLIAYHASARRGLLPRRGFLGWWQPGVNLLGCIFFGVAAIAGYVVPSTGSMLQLAVANWATAAGAACFLGGAVAALVGGHRSGPNAPRRAAPRPSADPPRFVPRG